MRTVKEVKSLFKKARKLEALFDMQGFIEECIEGVRKDISDIFANSSVSIVYSTYLYPRTIISYLLGGRAKNKKQIKAMWKFLLEIHYENEESKSPERIECYGCSWLIEHAYFRVWDRVTKGGILELVSVHIPSEFDRALRETFGNPSIAVLREMVQARREFREGKKARAESYSNIDFGELFSTGRSGNAMLTTDDSIKTTTIDETLN